MSKTRKHKIKGSFARKHKKHKKHRTIRNRDLIIPNTTPIQIRKISKKINVSLKKGSYSPTINKQLVTLKSIERTDAVVAS